MHCINIFILTFGFVNLPDVHGLSSTARILSSQLLSHIGRHTFRSSSLVQRVHRGISRVCPWEAWPSLLLSSRCRPPLPRTLTRARQSVSFPLHDCHLELIHVLGTLWRYEPRHRRSLFHHWSGLEPLRDCVPSLEPISRAHAENPPHQRCHLSAGARDQSSCHSCTQLLDIPEGPFQDFNRVVFEPSPAWPLLSTAHHPVHRATGLPHSPPSGTQSHRSQAGFHRTPVASFPVVQSPVVLRACTRHGRSGPCKEVS